MIKWYVDFLVIAFYVFLVVSCEQKTKKSQNDLILDSKTISPSLLQFAALDANQSLAGPCLGYTNFQDNSSKNILFYVTTLQNGGSPFVHGLRDTLTVAGYVVTITDTIDPNACTLWANYRQIWLLLPCANYGNTKSMDANSINALQQYYEAGGGLVILPGANYNYDGSVSCYKCNDNGAPVWGTSTDINAIKSLLKISFTIYSVSYNFNTCYTNDCTNNTLLGPLVFSDHPLAIAAKNLEPRATIQVNQDQNLDFIRFDLYRQTGFIDIKRNQLRSLAFILPTVNDSKYTVKDYGVLNKGCKSGTSIWWYDSTPTKSSPQSFVDIANYFETNLRKLITN
ncbi:MAG: hypothetical protein HY072_08405 [Deltaproteobacteria bacterium]|nr:hypothetical protein [Deltaproteobacteria bacterium]